MYRRSVIAALVGIGASAALSAPALAQPGTGSLAGSVRDTRGEVVADAEITVYPPDTSGNYVTKVRTDATGRFRVTGLEKGSYKLLIGLGGWFEWAPGRTDDATAATAYPVAVG